MTTKNQNNMSSSKRFCKEEPSTVSARKLPRRSCRKTTPVTENDEDSLSLHMEVYEDAAPHNVTPRSVESTSRIKTKRREDTSSDEDNVGESSKLFPNVKISRIKSKTILPSRENWCLFCCQCQTHIARHILTKHKTEPSVVEILELEKGSKERSLLLEKLRKTGNLNHNTKVMEDKCGTIRPSRRSRSVKTLENYFPCVHCKGLYSKAELCIHRKRCNFVSSDNCEVRKDNLSSTVQFYVTADISEQFKSEILLRMMNNDIYQILIKDKLIVQLGNHQFNEITQLKTKSLVIKNSMRNLGKLLKQITLLDSRIVSLEQILDERKWDLLVGATLNMMGLHNSKLVTPAEVITKLGENLDKICELSLQDEALPEDVRSRVEQFLGYKALHWHDSVVVKICPPVAPSAQPVPSTSGAVDAQLSEMLVTASTEDVGPASSDDEDQATRFSNVKISSIDVNSSNKHPVRENFCFFCGSRQTHIARHLLTTHKNEPLIIEVTSLPTGSQGRKCILEKLRKSGNSKHNNKVLSENCGTLRPCRRSKNIKKIDDFLPCLNCKGLYAKSMLSIHRRNCKSVPQQSNNRYASAIASVELLSFPSVSEEFKSEILYKMASNDIHRVIIQDPLIIKLGCDMYSQSQGNKTCNISVKFAMRNLARVVLEVRKLDPSILLLEQIISVHHWDHLVHAILSIYKSLGFKCVKRMENHVDVICQILLKDSKTNLDKKNIINEFIQLKTEKWDQDIKITNRTKYNFTSVVEDIKIITEFVKNNITQKLYEIKCNKNVNNVTWLHLAQNLLISLISLNRKNLNIISSIELSEYKNKIEPSPQNLNNVNLNKTEQFFTSILTQVTKTTTDGSNICLLLTKDMIEALDILIKTRETLGGVNSNNKYVFGNPQSPTGHLDAAKSYKNIIRDSDVKKCPLLKSNSVKNDIKYASQILGLGQFECGQLAVYLMYNLEITSNYYKLQDDSGQVAKLSLIFQRLDEENVNIYAKRKLEEIDVSVDVPSLCEDAQIYDQGANFEATDVSYVTQNIGEFCVL